MTKIEHWQPNESIGSILVSDIICDLVFQHNYHVTDQVIFTYTCSGFKRTVNPDNGFLVAVFKCKKKI